LAAPKAGPNSAIFFCARTPSRIAGSPGRSRRASMPRSLSTGGRAATTSPSPPVLTSGKTSAATCSTFMAPRSWRRHGREVSSCGKFLEHLPGDERDAAGAAIEALRVEYRVLAGHEAVRDHAAVVHHAAGQAGAAADLHRRQEHGLRDPRVRMHPALRKEQRAVQPPRDDAAARDGGLDGHADAISHVVHELRRRQLLLVGPDWPGG